MIGPWDVALVVAVTIQATVLAYVFDPRWKAFILMLPIPFTITTLSLAEPVGATHVLGLVLLLLFTHAVRLLHYNLRVPVFPAIVLAAGAYCAVGWPLASILPGTETVFWSSVAVTAVVAVGVMRVFPSYQENGHKSEAALWVKVPAIAAVALLLVAIKYGLRGFTTVFPMVGVVAVYEARKCLWTICRAIPAVILMLLTLMMVAHVTHDLAGLAGALAIGWGAFLCLLVPLAWVLLSREDAA